MEELTYKEQQQQGDYLDMAALLSICLQGELLILLIFLKKKDLILFASAKKCPALCYMRTLHSATDAYHKSIKSISCCKGVYKSLPQLTRSCLSNDFFSLLKVIVFLVVWK